jgi:protoheme IX farnesyltransferase
VSQVQRSALSVTRDLAALLKPNVTAMNVLAALGGAALAPGSLAMEPLLRLVVGTGAAVGSANVLNMILEREGDRLMVRTAGRPLPSGRLSVAPALLVSILLAILALTTLATLSALTAGIALLAILLYAFVYTPLKRRTPLALIVGAIPGAAPPLLGWTAVTGSIGAPGLVLFLVLMIWQIPHFLAIALFRQEDYARAGIRTVPVVRGERVAKAQAVAWAALLIPVSLALVPMGVAGPLYAVAAGGLGLWFLLMSVRGFRPDAGAAWARRLFLVSLVYLPGLCLALALDAALS